MLAGTKAPRDAFAPRLAKWLLRRVPVQIVSPFTGNSFRLHTVRVTVASDQRICGPFYAMVPVVSTAFGEEQAKGVEPAADFTIPRNQNHPCCCGVL
jgi:hypothetical protein